MIKLKDGMQLAYFAPSGNEALITVQGQSEGDRGALMVNWKTPPTDADIKACDSAIAQASDCDVNFSGRFDSRSEAQAAHDVYLKGQQPS